MARGGFWLVAVACVLLRLTPPWEVNHDCGWYLYVADQVLSGAGLYSDIVDVNPPLIVYLTMIPVAVSGWIGIPAVAGFDAFVLILVAVSLWLVRQAAWRTQLEPFLSREHLVLAALAVILVVLPGRDFGQREHLLLILVLPWFCLVAGRLGGAHVNARLGWTIGFVAGVGLCLKPHFLIAPLLVRVATAWQQRQLSQIRHAENEALVVALVMYGAHFLLVPYRSDFGVTLALVLDVYAELEIPSTEFLARSGTVQALVAGGLLLGVAVKAWPKLQVFALAWAACFAAAWWQHKGWSYHLLPAISIAFVGLLMFVVGRVGRGFAPFGIAALLACTVVPLGRHWLERAPDSGDVRVASPFTGITAAHGEVSRMRSGDTVLVFDTDMHTFFAWLQEHQVRWASRYACLWPLPGALVMEEHERSLRAAILEDLQRYCPTLIYVKRAGLSFIDDGEFDLLAWLMADPAIARELRHGYRREPREDGHVLFRR